MGTDARRAGPPGGPPLDAWLSDPQVRIHHRRAAPADADAVWAAATQLRLSDTRTLGRLVRWRIPGTPAHISFRELLRRYPFTLLDEAPRYSLSGLCGRIWTLRRDYARLGNADDFRTWDESGTVRVLIANWTEELPDGRVALCDEARVAPVDRRAAVRLRALWAAMGRFESLVGSEAVNCAVRRASS